MNRKYIDPYPHLINQSDLDPSEYEGIEHYHSPHKVSGAYPIVLGHGARSGPVTVIKAQDS